MAEFLVECRPGVILDKSVICKTVEKADNRLDLLSLFAHRV